MAERLTRKFLDALGIEADKQTAIIEAYRDALDPVVGERDDLKKQLEGMDTSEDWKAKYEKEHADFESFKTEQQNKDAMAAKGTVYRNILRDAGIADKHIDSIMRVSSDKVKGIELDKDGNAKKRDELVDSAKAEWADFIPVKVTVGSNVPHPPAQAVGRAMSKEDILKISDTQERQKAIAEHLDLFKKG